jgi:hypothetical protein
MMTHHPHINPSQAGIARREGRGGRAGRGSNPLRRRLEGPLSELRTDKVGHPCFRRESRGALLCSAAPGLARLEDVQVHVAFFLAGGSDLQHDIHVLLDAVRCRGAHARLRAVGEDEECLCSTGRNGSAVAAAIGCMADPCRWRRRARQGATARGRSWQPCVGAALRGAGAHTSSRSALISPLQRSCQTAGPPQDLWRVLVRGCGAKGSNGSKGSRGGRGGTAKSARTRPSRKAVKAPTPGVTLRPHPKGQTLSAAAAAARPRGKEGPSGQNTNGQHANGQNENGQKHTTRSWTSAEKLAAAPKTPPSASGAGCAAPVATLGALES